MKQTPTKQRMAENEVVFRQHNEAVIDGFEKVKTLANESMQKDLIPKDNTPLHFYCECSDENCHERIVLPSDTYSLIHKKRDQFIIVKGHEVETIEKIIKVTPTFSIVKKMIPLPKSADHLKTTPINNT